MLPNEYKPRSVRPMSEIINPGQFKSEADLAGNWYEDLQNYESNLDEMASATLDQNFKEEMQHVDQWYRYLTEAEKTATMYTLLQHSSQVQARFFINLLQQMVKRDPLYSLLTPSNPEQDMQNHLVGAMAKAELEASQRLMSVLPYKTGQVMSRPQSSTVNRRTTIDRHSFALGDTEEYSRLFGNSATAAGRSSDLLMNHSRSSSPYVNSLLDDNSIVAGNNNNSTTSSNGRRLVNGGGNNNGRGGASGRAMFNNAGRPHSVIEGDTTSLFPTASSSANWLTPTNSTTRRTTPTVGHIGDRSKLERPKSADISNWSLPTTTTTTAAAASSTAGNDNRSNGYQSVWGAQQRQLIPELDNDLIEFSQQQQQPFRRRANMNRIPVVPESDELVRATQDLFINDTFHKPIMIVNPPPTTSSLDPYGNFVMNSRPTSIVDNSGSTNITNYNNNNLNVLDEPDYASDHSEGSNMSRRRSSSMTPNARATKDKKAVEVIDMELLKDIPAWLRSLRLHKYNPIFSDTNWQTIVKMNDADLLAKGVAALGARRKMLKVFENVRAHCDANGIEY